MGHGLSEEREIEELVPEAVAEGDEGCGVVVQLGCTRS
jgi:hypothetical protein